MSGGTAMSCVKRKSQGMKVAPKAESSPRTNGPGEDWRSAFDSSANGGLGDSSRYGSNNHSRRNSDPSQNGELSTSSSSRSSSRRTPNRLPPAPPGSNNY